MTIGIWDAPPLAKTPEEEEQERRYKEAVAFGGAMDRDPNRMQVLLDQARRNKMLGQPGGDVVPIEETAGGPPDEAPAGSPPAAPRSLGMRRPLRTVQNLGDEGPTARANTPGLAQIEGRAAVAPGGAYEQADQDVMQGQMAQAQKSNAMRALLAQKQAEQRANAPQRPSVERYKTVVGPRGIGGVMHQDGNVVRPEPSYGSGMSNSVLAAMIRARAQAASDQARLPVEREKLRVKETLGAGREQGLNQRQKVGWEKKSEEREAKFNHQKEIEQAKIDSREHLASFEAAVRKALQSSKDKESLRRTVMLIESKVLGERSKKDSWLNGKDGSVAAQELDDQIKEVKEKFGL